MTTDAFTNITDIDTKLQELFSSLEVLRERYLSINTADDLEKLELEARTIGLKIADLSTARVLQERIHQPQFREECRDFARNYGKKLVYKGLRMVCVCFPGGNSVRLQVPYWSRKGAAGRKGKGLYPALYLLGIHDRCTPLLSSEIAMTSAALSSFEEARAMLESRGCSLNLKTIRKIAKRFANRARLSNNMDGLPLPEDHDLKGRRIVISTDGGRLRIRKNKKGRKTKRKRHRYNTDWREPKLIIIYAVSADRRIDKFFLPIIDGSLGGPDAVFGMIYRYLSILDVSEVDKLLFVADGALWIWERAPLLHVMLAKEGIVCEIIELIDFYHAVEHLNDFAKHMHRWSNTKKDKWVKTQKKTLKSGRIDEVIVALELAAKRSRDKLIRREVGYFVKNRHRFSYDLVAAAGLPIGSGAIESAIRRVVNLRLKSPCIFWNEDTAEEMLLLRSYYKTGRWEQLKTMAYRGGLKNAA